MSQLLRYLTVNLRSRDPRQSERGIPYLRLDVVDGAELSIAYMFCHDY
jgi:hypothetical protein